MAAQIGFTESAHPDNGVREHLKKWIVVAVFVFQPAFLNSLLMELSC